MDIYNRLLEIGLTRAGAAGCLANIMAESVKRSNNVEDRSGLDDASYTQGVDSGAYKDFVTDHTRCFYNCIGATNYADIPSGWK